MQKVTSLMLKTFEALKDVPEDQLQWLIDNSKDILLQDGQSLTVPGEPIAGPHFIINGRMGLYRTQAGSSREIAIFNIGDVTGYLPFSRAKVAAISSCAIGETQILSFPTERIREMIAKQFELTQALVHVMSNRVREFTSMQQQNEKMMALGKLSAGLAHELNNPASAIVRDSSSLKQHLRMVPDTFKKIIGIRMDSKEVDAVNNELFRMLEKNDTIRLTLKQRTAREDELGEWFAEKEVENAYEMADIFTEYNFTVADLETFAKHIPTDYLSPVFNWINSNLVTEKMVEDIGESSKRIADLVSSVKTFTHMDRGTDKEYADIHTGIGNTLTMLGYKLKKANVTLVEDFDQTLPKVKAMIGELNQVWTNLIDNALDAMEPNGKGTLTIKTERDREFVQVTIIDDGPGIPENILSRIFDPFFTTKEMGKGTGLGLEVVQRIVNQHNGSVKVKSQPGDTEFYICFPIDG